ncbi:MAG TPA: hypothetical protein PKD00_00630 [Burkholderiales bacterium]|nr:hypothetical protein [Burkholderiales bacterium]
MCLFINLQAQPKFPYFDATPEADRVQSVYGSMYNTHYSSTLNEWTMESNSIHTFSVILLLNTGEIDTLRNLQSLTIHYTEDFKIKKVVGVMYEIEMHGNSVEIIDIIDTEKTDVMSVVMSKL